MATQDSPRAGIKIIAKNKQGPFHEYEILQTAGRPVWCCWAPRSRPSANGRVNLGDSATVR